MGQIELVRFLTPEWLEVFSCDHPMRISILESIKSYFKALTSEENIHNFKSFDDNLYIENCVLEHQNEHELTISIRLYKKYYFEYISNAIQCTIKTEQDLMNNIKYLFSQKQKYEKYEHAFNQVFEKGYSIIAPDKNEISLCEPEVIKQGSKHGVDIRAKASSIHMIKVDIETDISPIVGSKQQAEDLMDYINKSQKNNHDAIWDILIFGKSIGELVDDEISDKIHKMTEPCQDKIQNALEKIMNGNRGHAIFVIV